MESAQQTSGALKIVGATLAGGALAGVAALGLTGAGSTLMWTIIGVGLILITVLLAGYVLAVKKRASKRAAAADRGLLDMMRVRPRGVSDPLLLAKLDQLGEKFEEGLRKYHRATGERVSESPWYLLVGEPGSGKTEAIRHCGVEFPAGLHEEQQGAGGTTNMDWWFTEEAIILDTAGRYALEAEPRAGAEPGAQQPTEQQVQQRERTDAEWSEFLKLIRNTRPDCPVNGLLLVIPATSLLKDGPAELERKGNYLAKFLDRIRRTLEIRFPVFVLVTKSDLIPGFREFFEHVDYNLQQQMLGWSKPGSLDEPFDPDDVDEYLESVRDKLYRRRLTLLQDPVHTEVPGARRTDQVDALYTFPDRFAALAPKLRQYLQIVFVKNKFNQNPLFLRGIYFTSSMEQGAALDEALAKIRGISIEQLEDEGRTWTKNRPIFLRDLFMTKVFVEKGLVTRETNTRSVKRKRQVATLATGIAATLLLGGFLYVSYRQLKAAVLAESALTGKVADASRGREWDLFRPAPTTKPNQREQFTFNDRKPAETFGDDERIPWFYTARMEAVRDALPVPAMFAWVKSLGAGDDLNVLRRKSAESMYQAHVLRPLLDEAAKRMGAPGRELPTADWGVADSPGAIALVTLLDAQAARGPAAVTAGPASRPTLAVNGEQLLAGLASFTLADAQQFEQFRNYSAPLGQQLDRISAGDLAAKLRDVAPSDSTLNAATKRGVEEFNKFWENVLNVANPDSPLNNVSDLHAKLTAYRLGLDEFDLAAKSTPAAKLEEYQARAGEAKAHVEKLRGLAREVDTSLSALNANRYLKDAEGATIEERVGGAIARLRNDAEPIYDRMIAAAGGPTTPNGRLLSASFEKVKNKRTDPEIRRLLEQLAADSRAYLNDLGEGRRLYAAAVDVLADATGQLSDPPAEQPKPDASLEAVEQRLKATKESLAARLAGKSPNDPSSIAGPVATLAGRLLDTLAAPAQGYVIANRLIADMPGDPEVIAKRVADASELRDDQILLTSLPSFATNPDLEREIKSYHYEAADGVIARFRELKGQLKDDAKQRTILNRPQVDRDLAAKTKAMDAYVDGYYKFWLGLRDRYYAPVEFKTWAEYRAALAKVNAQRAIEASNVVIDRQVKALAKIDGFVEKDSQMRRDGALERSRLNQILQTANPRELTQMRDRWTRLPAGVPDAVNAILQMSPASFLEQYFPAGNDQPFFNALFFNGLKTLALEQAAAGGGAVSLNYAKFVQSFGDKFPVVRKRNDLTVAEPILNAQEIAAALASINAILPGAEAQAGRGGGPAGDGSLIASGGKTGEEPIDEQLGILVGKPLAAERIADLKRSRAILEWALRTIQQQPNATMKLVAIAPPRSYAMPANVTAADNEFQSLNVQVGNQPSLKPGGVFLRDSEKNSDVAAVTFAGTGNPVRLTFTTAVGGGRAVTVTLPSDRWLALQALSMREARVRPDNKSWEFPLYVSTPQPNRPGAKIVQWFLLTSDNPPVLPPAIEWPER